MKTKKITLLSSFLAIVLCMSLIAGTTFALFTSESKVNIAATSGKVKVTAMVDGLTLYSATTEETGDVAGTIAEGAHAATYYYEEVSPTFTNGGTATYAENGNTLTLERVTPGDKVNFNVAINNESNVNIKYRVLVNVTSGLKLFNALKVKIDGTSLTGVSRTGTWTSLVANGSISAIPVEIYLPIEAGNEYQDLATAMSISVEAVQGNAKTTDSTLTSEVVAVAEASAVTNEEKETTAQTVITDSDNLVTVTVPQGTKLTATTDPEDDLSLAVKVKPQDTVSNITVLSTQASASYDVSVLLVVNGVVDENASHAVDNENNEEEITVSMFIGTGLTGVKLYHIADEIEYDSYNSETGYITFKTTSFSEYTVLYNKDFVYETFDENGDSTGITVLEATETAGVYKSTDENDEEVLVTVSEDENGNVTETSGDIVLISQDGVATAYARLDTALADNRENTTVKLLKDYVLPSDYSYVDMFEGTFDGQGYKIYTSQATVNYLIERTTKTATFKDFTMVESAHLVYIADYKWNYTEITFDNVDYTSLDDTYYQLEHNGSLYTSYCYDYAVGWGGTVNIVDCDVNMNLKGADSSNSAVFFGGYFYAFDECQLNVKDCSYTGTFRGNYIALILSNGQNYTNFNDHLNVSGLINNGNLIGVNGAYAVGGQNHTGECSDVRWIQLYNDIQEDAGGAYVILSSANIAVEINDDKTITIVDNGTNASSYKMLLYASRDVYNAQGVQYASNYNFGIQFDFENAGATSIKKLKMVDYETAIEDGIITASDCTGEWIENIASSEYTAYSEYQIVTKNDVSYYIVRFGTSANGDTYTVDLQEVTVLIMAYNSDGLLIDVAEQI